MDDQQRLRDAVKVVRVRQASAFGIRAIPAAPRRLDSGEDAAPTPYPCAGQGLCRH